MGPGIMYLFLPSAQMSADDNGRVARMKGMLSKGGGGMPGLLPPKPRPKPKAKPKPVSTVATTTPRDSYTDGENATPPPVSPDDHMVWCMYS